jgi:diacylglycerol kinase (ATP)
MAGQQATGLTRLVNACYFSAAGFKAAWQHEEAFRQEVVLLGISTPLAIWLGQTTVETLFLIGSVVLLLLVELINSAIEAVVDRIGLEQHELSKRAKDIGSAAVALTMVWAITVWVFLLLT